MADVHADWLCSDCIVEKRKDCALADPEITSGSSRCWEPLPEGVDVTQPMPSDAVPEREPNVFAEPEREPVYTAVLLPDGRVEHLRREGVYTEDISDEESDSVHAAQRAVVYDQPIEVVEMVGFDPDDVVVVPGPSPRQPTVADILNTPYARAQREQRDQQVRAVAERLGWTYDTPEAFEVTTSYRDGETVQDALHRAMAELRERLDREWIEEGRALEERRRATRDILFPRPGSMRQIDLRLVEGKTQEEIAELIRARHENHVHIDPYKEPKMDILQALGRGARLGAALAVGVTVAWAAADRVWSRWR